MNQSPIGISISSAVFAGSRTWLTDRQTDRRTTLLYLCTPTILVNSGVTGPKFTRFTHNIARTSQMNFSKSEWRYCNPFQNTRAANSCILTCLLTYVLMGSVISQLSSGSRWGDRRKRCCYWPIFVGLERAENVVVVVAKQSKHGADVEVLQHRTVVIDQRHVRPGVIKHHPANIVNSEPGR